MRRLFLASSILIAWPFCKKEAPFSWEPKNAPEITAQPCANLLAAFNAGMVPPDMFGIWGAGLNMQARIASNLTVTYQPLPIACIAHDSKQDHPVLTPCAEPSRDPLPVAYLETHPHRLIIHNFRTMTANGKFSAKDYEVVKISCWITRPPQQRDMFAIHFYVADGSHFAFGRAPPHADTPSQCLVTDLRSTTLATCNFMEYL